MKTIEIQKFKKDWTNRLVSIFLDRFRKKDEDFSNETKVSWAYVENSFSSTIEEIKRKKCPKCELESPSLEWFIFRSSRDSWMQLSGSAGLYSKCPNCEIIVDQIITVVS